MYSLAPFYANSFADVCKALLCDKDRLFFLFLRLENTEGVYEDLKSAISYIKTCAGTVSEQIEHRLFEETFVCLTKAKSHYSGKSHDISAAIKSIQDVEKERCEIEEQQSGFSELWEFFTNQNQAKSVNNSKMKLAEKTLEESFGISFVLSYIRTLLGLCFKLMGDLKSMIKELDGSISFYVDCFNFIKNNEFIDIKCLLLSSSSATCEFISLGSEKEKIDSLYNYNNLIRLVSLEKILYCRNKIVHDGAYSFFEYL